MMRQCTRTGRVVYDRPKHRWTLKDCRRILPAAGVRNFPVPSDRIAKVSEKLVEVYQVLMNDPDTVITFGGGSFGGGGAFRPFSTIGYDVDAGVSFILDE